MCRGKSTVDVLPATILMCVGEISNGDGGIFHKIKAAIPKQ